MKRSLVLVCVGVCVCAKSTINNGDIDVEDGFEWTSDSQRSSNELKMLQFLLSIENKP